MFNLFYGVNQYFFPSFSSPSQIENEKTLTTLRLVSTEAMEKHEKLMLSWSKNPPSSDIHADIIEQLSENIKWVQTPLSYKILCALWISKLDPEKKHDDRVKPLVDCLHSDDIDDHTADLFKAFSMELSDAEWEKTRLKMLDLLSNEYHLSMDTLAQIIQVLSAGFLRFNFDHQFEVLNAFLNQMSLATDVAQPHLVDAITLAFTQADFHRDENLIISFCLAKLYQSNPFVVQNALLTLSSVFPLANAEQKALITNVITKIVEKSERLHVALAMAKATAACYKDAAPDQQTTLLNKWIQNLTHKYQDIQEAALTALSGMYAHANPEQQKLIVDNLEKAFSAKSAWNASIAKTLHELPYEKSDAMNTKILHFLGKNAAVKQENATTSYTTTVENIIRNMPNMDDSLRKSHITLAAEPSVGDQLIIFCARTFNEVKAVAAPEKKAAASASIN